jgi:hypothetical protein
MSDVCACLKCVERHLMVKMLNELSITTRFLLSEESLTCRHIARKTASILQCGGSEHGRMLHSIEKFYQKPSETH